MGDTFCNCLEPCIPSDLPEVPHTIPAFSRGIFFIRSPRDMFEPCLIPSPGSPAGMPNSRQTYLEPSLTVTLEFRSQPIRSDPKGIYRKKPRKMPLGCADQSNKEALHRSAFHRDQYGTPLAKKQQVSRHIELCSRRFVFNYSPFRQLPYSTDRRSPRPPRQDSKFSLASAYADVALEFLVYRFMGSAVERGTRPGKLGRHGPLAARPRHSLHL
jgi:hypothetical protein